MCSHALSAVLFLSCSLCAMCFSAGPELEAVCHLAILFISNVNVSGYSVTASVHVKAGALLSSTSQHALAMLRCSGFKLVSSHLMTPRGAGVPPFHLCSSLVHSLPHLLLFITFSLFPFLIHFTYFLLLSIRSLSTRIVPLRFQA